MKKQGKYIIAAIALIAILVLSTLGYNYLSSKYRPEDSAALRDTTAATQSAAQEGSTAPVIAAADFTVTDIDGSEVKLSDYFGKPIVVNFWTTWCGPCRAELPDFDAACAEYGEEVVFLMVNLTDGYRETQDTVKNFLREEGYTFPVYLDTQSDAAYAYGVNSIPMTVFINADSTVSDYHIGLISEPVLLDGIAALIGG